MESNNFWDQVKKETTHMFQRIQDNVFTDLEDWGDGRWTPKGQIQWSRNNIFNIIEK